MKSQCSSQSVNPRRIAVFLPTLNGGGAERAMISFAEGAAMRGYDVQLVVGNPKGPLREILPSNIELIELNMPRMAKALFPLVRYLKEHRPAAIYATVQHANLTAIAAARISGVGTKVIVRQSTSHRSAKSATWRHAISQFMIPWLYPLADGVIAVSTGVGDQLRSVNKSLNVHVLPNPVFTPAFDALGNEAVDHPWFAPGEPPVILAAARLHPFKGFAGLIRAFAEIRKTRPCRLVILGEGPDRSNLERIAVKLGVHRDIDLPGFVSNPLPYMRLARVFTLCSEYEGMPNVLLQAMASGTAVVSTDCPSGPREILDGGRRGHLVPIGDDAALASAISRALFEGPKADAEEYVRSHFSLDRAVDSDLRIAGLYTGVGADSATAKIMAA